MRLINACSKAFSNVQVFLEREVPEMASGSAEPLPSLLRQTPASSLTAYAGMDKLPHPMDGNGIAYLGTGLSEWKPMQLLANFLGHFFSAANVFWPAFVNLVLLPLIWCWACRRCLASYDTLLGYIIHPPPFCPILPCKKSALSALPALT